MAKKNLAVIVLAAGKSRRTRTDKSKVLLELAGEPLIGHICQTLKKIRLIKEHIIVVGHQAEEVKKTVISYLPQAVFVKQTKINGTAKAVSTGLARVKSCEYVLIICGDTPLLEQDTLVNLIKVFFQKRLKAIVATAFIPGENDYGRIFRDSQGRISAVVEKSENLPFQEKEEINTGIYIFHRSVLENFLPKIKINPKKKEYYLTDIINLLYKHGVSIGSFLLPDYRQILGVNTQRNLAIAQNIIYRRICNEFMDKGIQIIDPQTTFIQKNVKIGKGTVIYPFTFIEKHAIIGNNCSIGPFAYIQEGRRLKPSTRIVNNKILP